MAVPASGTLTMLGIAQERKFGTYGTGTISSPILMTDLINGGGSNSFPSLNTSSPSKPNTATPHSMSEWYSYDQDYAQWRSFDILDTEWYDEAEQACSTGEPDTITLYYDDGASGTGQACPDDGVVVYTTSAMTTAYDGFDLWWHSDQCTRAYMISSAGNIDSFSDC